MIILLDTSTPVCKLTIYDDTAHHYEWEAGRTLAHGLLRYIQETLAVHSYSWRDIQGIVVFKGPGSFTGLRIGLTVLNTLADTYALPIVGQTGQSWQSDGLARLQKGQSDGIVLPLYGSAPHITTPRK